MPAAPKRKPAEPSLCRGWRGELIAECGTIQYDVAILKSEFCNPHYA
jgi:hypothetical protein